MFCLVTRQWFLIALVFLLLPTHNFFFFFFASLCEPCNGWPKYYYSSVLLIFCHCHCFGIRYRSLGQNWKIKTVAVVVVIREECFFESKEWKVQNIIIINGIIISTALVNVWSQSLTVKGTRDAQRKKRNDALEDKLKFPRHVKELYNQRW